VSRQPTDAAATQLARGAAKTSDIEGTRRDLARAEHVVADGLHAAAERCEHEAKRLEDAPRSAAAGGRPAPAARH
jgi:hypothetical protein